MKSCPVCKTDAFNSLLHRFPQGDVLICGQCGLGIFDGPMPTSVAVDIPASHLFGWVKRAILSYEFRPLASLPPLKVLDIGAGSGELAFILHNLGHSVTCNDASEENTKRIEADYGLPTLAGTLEDQILQEGSFEAIIMRHVFEHFDAPDATADFVLAALVAGGRLIVTQPNMDSWARRVGGREWNWTLPYHRFFWNESAFSKFFESKGCITTQRRAIFSHLGLPRCLGTRIRPGALQRLLAPATLTLGTALELVAIPFHKAQNLYMEFRKGG